ncbi:MAG: hypothetical protein IJ906_13940, partial [Oscillospiraceae bacterium]|nr:hypothetical protein [Oscillospiraceae bacterium]
MNIEQTLRSLKQTSHDSLAEKIETEYPVTWNEERIFQQSYRRYLAQNITTEPIMPAERRYTRLAKFAGLAACLLVTIGLSIGVWSKHQRIEPRPPQETQTTTVVQTETRIATIEQVTAETQTTGKQTEESTKKPETTADPIQTSDRVQPSESAAALLTTAFQTETAASAAPQTDAAEVGTRQTTPLAASTHTALPQTSVTAKIQGQIAPVTEQSTTNMPTNPATTTVIITTTLPRTDPTETSRPTEPQQTDTTEPAHTSKPIETTATVQASQAPGYEERYDLLPGFRVEIKGEELTTIYSIDPVSPSPSEIYAYILDSERFSIQSVQQDFSSRANYDIYDSDTRHHLTLRQNKRSVFMSSFRRKGTLESQSIGEYSGYWIFDNQGTRLVWDDGKYTFELFGPNEYKE